MAAILPRPQCVNHDDMEMDDEMDDEMETFPHYWPFVRGGNSRSLLNSLHKGQWRGALMFSLIYTWINGWVYGEAGDLRCHHAHYDVTVMRFK